jgi:amino acid adenylation domain-containing protein
VAFSESEVEGTLSARFENMARRYNSRLAVKTAENQLSYGELNDKANAVAAAIQSRCGKIQSPVALLFEMGADDIAAILAVLKSGHFYVSLDPSYPVARLNRIIEDAQPSLLLTNVHNAQTARRLSFPTENVLEIDQVESRCFSNPVAGHGADALAYIMYTSGSSGEPKGVLQSHRNVLFDIRRQSIDLQTTINDRYGLLFSSSSSASVCHIFGALLNGAAVLPFDLREAGFSRLTHWLKAEEITILDINVALFRQWCAALEQSPIRAPSGLFPRLRLLAPGSEPLYQSDIELYRRYFSSHCILQNAMGTTETRTVTQYFLNHHTPIFENLVPVGKAVDGKEILLLDKNGQQAAPGAIGEIAVRSRYLSPGYWQRPQYTAAVFQPDPEGGEQRIYLTGDLGRYDNQGQLVHLGRKDFQVKIRGHRLELAEVETALFKLTDRPAAATAFKDSAGNQQLVAYLVVDRRCVPSIRDVRFRLRQILPDHAVPTRFEFLDALPLTANGKLNRRALPPPTSFLHAASKKSFVKPSGDYETRLAQLYEEILAVNPVGATDDFFALGGHSLLAAQLTLRIEQEWKQVISPSTIVKAPTVRELSCYLEQTQASHRQTLIPIQKGDANQADSPLFCLPGAAGNALQFHRFASYLGHEQPVYGFDPHGMDGRAVPHKTIEAMARHYMAAIKTVQSAGPYFLCGFSMGGIVAFEMARRLRDAGDEVALLALFDTDCPGARKIFAKQSWRSRIALRSRLRRYFRQLKYHYYLCCRRHVPSRICAEHIECLHASAANRYVAGKYPGRITYFRAKERKDRWRQPLPDGGWESESGAEVEAYDIMGNHRLIQEPYVGELARLMRNCIEEAKQKHRSVSAKNVD